MHLLAKIPYACVQLRWSEAVTGWAEARANQLRGALAHAFAGDDWFHQHDGQGKPLYRYPRVQYRWRDGQGIVIGWGDAAERLLQAPWLELPLRLGNQDVVVSDALMTTQHSVFAVSERLHPYRWHSPVLLFNQANYQRYQNLNETEQREERDRLLVAQLLTAMRGLQVEFPTQLYATFTQTRTRVCHYKQQELMGILGLFVCNAVLPDGFAIGHAVSHGYGWLSPAG
ncbi:MAG: CRISPR-associated endonuclease Cas6 [Candidatus Competibacteraceae bacterium]